MALFASSHLAGMQWMIIPAFEDVRSLFLNHSLQDQTVSREKDLMLPD